MPLVNQTFPGLYNGVSQQPPTLRLDTQGELQENALSDLVDGLQNRPPTEWISNLTDSAASSSAFFHTIQRSETEKYIVVITEDATSPVEVYTIDGQKCTIRYGTLDADGGDFSPDDAVKDYVLQDDDGNPVTPRNAFKAVTVADYTILTNIKRIAKMKDTASPDPDPEAIVYVKRGVASADYNVEVFVNGSQVGSASYSSDDTTEPDTYKTTEIASSLQTDLAASLGTGWTLTSLGSSFTVKNDSQTPFSIKVSDSYGNDALVAVNHTVQDFADLPPEAPDGYVVKVEGDAESSFDNFYVQYRLDEDGTGIWSETVKPGIQNEMDEMTLPHRLVRTGELEFTLAPIVWSPRGVGDESSAPAPSFIGRTVNNVFFFKNRLGFLSGENVVMSQAGNFFDLFPTTTTDVLDNDPIDVAVANTQVSVLDWAVPYQTSLLLFSNQRQFILSSGSLITPTTISIDPTASFTASTRCEPVAIGPNVYFAAPNGEYTRIREYFVQPETQINDAADVTAHVPRYVPSDLTHLTSSSASDALFALSNTKEPNSVYVYKYHWNGQQKSQSSWSVWSFDTDNVLYITVVDNVLYLVTQNGSEISLLRLRLEKPSFPEKYQTPNGLVEGPLFNIHLDKRALLEGVYDPETNETTWNLPYSDPALNGETDRFVVVDMRGRSILNVEQVDATTLKAPGEHLGYYLVGKKFTMRYRFTQWYIRGQNGMPQMQGRLQVRSVTVAFTNSGYFRIESQSLNRETTYDEFVVTRLGVSKIGIPTLLSDEYRFLVLANTADTKIDLVNDTYLPSIFQTVSFEGFWTPRSRPLS